MTQPHFYTETLPAGLSFEMILVEGGHFMMGGEGEDALDSETPVHSVSVPSFYLGRYLCTQALWQTIMGKNPSRFPGEERPVETVSWKDTQAFIARLNRLTGQAYRLPTEAEWEFAARGGIHSEGYLYAGSDKLREVGWYKENATENTKAVGLLLPNELGLYDMSGNIFEWCADDWHETYRGAPSDGTAWIDGELTEEQNKGWLAALKGRPATRPMSSSRGSHRILRGGGWGFDAPYCRVSYRSHDRPEGGDYDIGFRLALSPQSAAGFPTIQT
ncbi:MAG: formylglycine-generating enzyme family protein [Bacteroidota bacterium]